MENPGWFWMIFWVLFKVMFYFPNRKSTIWGIYSEDFLFFGNPLSKSKFRMIFGLKHPRLFWRHLETIFFKVAGFVDSSPNEGDHEVVRCSRWQFGAYLGVCQSEPLVNDDLGSWGSEKTSIIIHQQKTHQWPHENSFSPARFLYRSGKSLWLAVNAGNHHRWWIISA